MSLRRTLNPIFRKYGYELVKRDYFQEALEREYERAQHFTFLQIGANDGIMMDPLFPFVISHDCQGVVVEPLKPFFEQLSLNYAIRPKIKPVQMAVHESESSFTLHYVDPKQNKDLPEWTKGIGSFNREHLLNLGVDEQAIISQQVPCMHLMKLIQAHCPNHLNLLQIDVEGYDAQVIKMIDFDQIKPGLIKFESAHIPETEYRSIKGLLVSQGYSVQKQAGDTIAQLP